MEANNTNVPKGVIKDQWISLVSNWMSQKAQVHIDLLDLSFTCRLVILGIMQMHVHCLQFFCQDISEKNRENSTMKKSIHTAGTKSFARNREELVSI
jgi:hypothetical protein